MFTKSLLLSSLSIAAIALSSAVSAQGIVNGNFDTDLSGWSTETNGGFVDWIDGTAVLSTGPGFTAFSAVLVQGDDGSFSFNNPILLTAGFDLFKFDAVFSTLGQDVLETGLSGFTDNLQLWLYDANDLSGSGDALIATIDALTSGGPGFSFDLTPYLGQLVAFSFELNDEDDGFDSQVTLDNVRIETSPVPLPGALLFEMTALLGLAGNGWRKRRQNA